MSFFSSALSGDRVENEITAVVGGGGGKKYREWKLIWRARFRVCCL